MTQTSTPPRALRTSTRSRRHEHSGRQPKSVVLQNLDVKVSCRLTRSRPPGTARELIFHVSGGGEIGAGGRGRSVRQVDVTGTTTAHRAEERTDASRLLTADEGRLTPGSTVLHGSRGRRARIAIRGCSQVSDELSTTSADTVRAAGLDDARPSQDRDASRRPRLAQRRGRSG